jgi:hypothetical protein
MTDAKDMDRENARLLHLIGETAQHWYALTNDIRIPWEGDLNGAMKAACDEIRKLTRERDGLLVINGDLASDNDLLIVERDEARRDAAAMCEALVTLGITKGEVDGRERWWHIRPDDSEAIHANVMLAADALWADYRARTADAGAA